MFWRIALLCGVLLVMSTLGIVGYNTWRDHAAVSAFKKQIALKNDAFQHTLDAYNNLLKQLGPVRGQDILQALMPNDSRTHMVNHETGRFLYNTYGPSGMQWCKNYFAGGCFHGFVEAHIEEYGHEDIAALVQSCRNATASDQEMQCPHGVGHALLVAAGYDQLPRALDFCAESFPADRKSRVNCYDGVFMENGFGPFSVPPADRWYKQDDVMYPCNEEAVLKHDGAHEYCWGMQSQATLRADAYPQFAGDIARVGAYCEALTNWSDQKLCFEGLARQLQWHYPHDADRRAVLCGELTPERQHSCIWQANEAAYIYGSRAPEIMNMCTHASEHEKMACYEIFYEGIAISYSKRETRIGACAELPEFRDECVAWIHSPRAQRF